MSQRYLPEVLYENGFTDLISVVPPGVTISPGSKLLPSMLGKTPGRRNKNGTWGGYPWQKAAHAVDDVREWMMWQANVGLRADHFPGLDIDSEDQQLAAQIEQLALQHLGEAPVRYGRRPKRLMMYTTDAPFGRLRIWGTRGVVGADSYEKHLVEILGTGQQYLVYGVHPSGAAYQWTSDVSCLIPDLLTPITREQAEQFRERVAELFRALDFEVSFEGDGAPASKTAADQLALRAPSLDTVFEAMRALPNDGDFDSRDEWLNVAYALKAACGPEGEHEARELFLEWSLLWKGDAAHPKGNDPALVLEEFRRCVPPYKIGWPWLAELARGHGFSNVTDDFEALDPAGALPDLDVPEPAPEEPRAKRYSDFWLAEEVLKQHADDMRYSPERGLWYIWTGKLWKPDAGATRALRLVHNILWRVGRERAVIGDKEAAKESKAISSNAAIGRVEAILRHAPGVAIELASLDADPYLLNTPDGLIDLKTAEKRLPDPAALCSKTTSVAPDFGGPCPEWRRFIAEATDGDRALEAYLQRYAGYCLTGCTTEQQFSVFHGAGGNGKGTFKTALETILGDYATTAQMETFVERGGSKGHPTDVAALAGARLVTATEVNNRQQLDSSRLKEFSGGDRIAARHMRQDMFVFEPKFKLLLQMNNPPNLRDNTEGMRRRLHLVPFIKKPAIVDKQLREKLTAEHPAILAWMIEGALLWNAEGLNPPVAVLNMTEEHFEDEDHVARWLRDRVEASLTEDVRVIDAWKDYNAWASEQGIPPSKASHVWSRELKSYVKVLKNDARQSVLRGQRLRATSYATEGLEVLP